LKDYVAQKSSDKPKGVNTVYSFPEALEVCVAKKIEKKTKAYGNF